VEAIGTESASRRSVEEELTCHIRCFPVERFAVGLPKTLPGAEHIRWDAAWWVNRQTVDIVNRRRTRGCAQVGPIAESYSSKGWLLTGRRCPVESEKRKPCRTRIHSHSYCDR